MHASFLGKTEKWFLLSGSLPERPQVRQRISGGDDAQAKAILRQTLEQRGNALVFQLAGRGTGGRMLQRLQSVENQQATSRADDTGNALALLERAGGAGGK